MPLIALADMTGTVVVAVAADYLAVGGLAGSAPLAGSLFRGSVSRCWIGHFD